MTEITELVCKDIKIVIIIIVFQRGNCVYIKQRHGNYLRKKKDPNQTFRYENCKV